METGSFLEDLTDDIFFAAENGNMELAVSFAHLFERYLLAIEQYREAIN